MLIPSPAVCPSVDAGEQLAHPSSESRGAKQLLRCVLSGANWPSSVISCPRKALLPHRGALCLMSNEKATVTDCGACPSLAGWVHR